MRKLDFPIGKHSSNPVFLAPAVVEVKEKPTRALASSSSMRFAVGIRGC